MKKINRLSLMMAIIMVLVPTIAFAHGLFLTLEEPGVLKAEYDGGGFSPRMEVVLFDSEGNEIERGPVNDEGKYEFDTSLDVARAEVDDGMGHKAEYKEGVESKSIPKLPVIIGVFVVVAVIYFVFSKKNK